ncbi:MAG: carboxypeptidase regulatory-like domain-containing protein [Candidatus Competibacteraceae bacterium]
MDARYYCSYNLLRLLALILLALQAVSLRAEPPVLASEQILLYGLGLKVEPAYQPTPKDVATVVSTYLQAPTLPPGQKPPLPDNAVVKATLVGPGLVQPLEYEIPVNGQFEIPPLPRAGLYSLENIRVLSGNTILFYAQPERVTIEVLERLLITTVTVKPLTAQEIRDKGIVFDRSNFQAYNFTAAFAVKDEQIQIDFPVLLPRVFGAADVEPQRVALPDLSNVSLIRAPTIIPDTLKLAQTKIPNLIVHPTFLEAQYQGKTLDIEPIPGVIVIPGDIAFLNQYFSVMLMVANAAPSTSVLAVQDLKAKILLPPGNDGVANSPDDPLRMAQTERGESPRQQNVVGAGADHKLGTADDQPVIAAGQSGSAEFLIEGRREGSHNLELELEGTLTGLPVGPVSVRGRAAGTVLVRNPTFTLTFTHPDVVNEGEDYNLDITVTNTSESPANVVSLDLYPQHISGAVLVGTGHQEIDSIPPNDSATVSYHLKSLVTGGVYAATLDSDEKVAGRFLLKTAVGELGIPLSPDSLVLPPEAQFLPAALRKTVIALLGKTYAAATAPAGALPKDVTRFSKKMVWDRAVETAEAGLRKQLHEPLPDTLAHLWLDFAGGDYGRLAERYPDTNKRAAAEQDFIGFDELRRRSQRGDAFAAAVAAELRSSWITGAIDEAHRAFAEKVSFRPAHVSVALSANGAPLPYRLVLLDGNGNRLGEVDEASGKIGKAIPFSDLLNFRADDGVLQGQLALVAAPTGAGYTIRLERTPGTPAAPFDLSLVLPADSPSGLRQVVFKQLLGDATPLVAAEPGDPYAVQVEFAEASAGAPAPPTASAPIADPPPTVLGAVQQAKADTICCHGLCYRIGRIIAALFSEEVTPASAQDRFERGRIDHYAVDDNEVVSVALQPKGRIVFLALRDPVGLVERNLSVTKVEDRRGHKMTDGSQTIDRTVTNTQAGGEVSGRVLHADGTPVPFADTRLFTRLSSCGWAGISAKPAGADGRYHWDFVVTAVQKTLAIAPSSGENRPVIFNVARNGQRLEVNVVLLGRTLLQGHVYAENGFTPLKDAEIKVTSLTDYSLYGAKTDAAGYYAIDGVPVGGVVIEAVHPATQSQRTASVFLPQAGKTVEYDLTLLTEATRNSIATYGDLSGHVLEGDGSAPVANLPVIVYYLSNSQKDVICDRPDAESYCAVAAGATDAAGAFAFSRLPAGQLKVYTYDQSRLQEAKLLVQLPPDGQAQANVRLAGGVGVVHGVVLDASGQRVAGAEVGGGFSLSKTNAKGEFLLEDVPVDVMRKRRLIAVSEALGAMGSTEVDIRAAGDVVGATIVLNGTGKVKGTVRQADKTPVAGLDVYLWHKIWVGDEISGEPQVELGGTATTDSDGRYQIDKAPLGQDYTLSAFLPDFSDGNTTPVALVVNGQTAKADVVFRGKGRITGVLYDDDGQTPLQGRVALSAPRVVTAGPIGLGFTYTANLTIVDTDLSTGHFNFDGVFVGPASLAAVGPFSPHPVVATLTMPYDGAVVEKTLKLEPNGHVVGTVYRPDGVTPAGPGVKVTLRGYKIVCVGLICREVPEGIQEETVVTDENGHYELPLVHPGKFELKAELAAAAAPDHVQRYGFVRAAVQAGQTAEMPIRLLGMSEVRIEVYGSDGKTSVQSPKIKVRHRLVIPGTEELRDDGSFGMERSGTANEQGLITFGGGDALPEGEITVLAQDLDHGFAGRAWARLAQDGQTVTVKVYLYNAAGAVSGVIFRPDGQTPAPNAEVAVANAQGSLAYAVTDEQGHYQVDTIPLGAFRVDAFEAATGRRGYGQGAIDTAGQEVLLNITQTGMGFVKGKLLSLEDLTPLAGWPLELDQPDPGGRTDPLTHHVIHTIWKATSGIDGSFEFPAVSVGRFKLRTEKQPLGSGRLETRVSSEGQVVDLPLRVEVAKSPRGTLAGWVYRPDGNPAAAVPVEICLFVPFGCANQGATPTGENGDFVFPDLPLGRYGITIKAQGSAEVARGMAVLSFAGRTEYITLSLPGLGSIAGVVLRADGTTAGGAKITLQGYTQYADADGHFQFLKVPAGRFTLQAEDISPFGLKGMVSDILHPGQAISDLVVRLGPSARLEGRAVQGDGRPVPGVIVELARTDTPIRTVFYAESDANGHFAFAALPAPYRLTLQDPLGVGRATAEFQLIADKDLKDIILDQTLPGVSATQPPAGAGKAPLDSPIQIGFSEPVAPATVNQNTVQLVDDKGWKIDGKPIMGTGDTSATFQLRNPLQDGVRYTLRVSGGPPFRALDKDGNGFISGEEALRYYTLSRNFEQYDSNDDQQLSPDEYPGGVEDRVGHGMTGDFISAFTTVDLTPPTRVSVSPGPGSTGIAEDSVLRIQYSEPIDLAAFTGPAVSLTSAQGPVQGRLDWILGNTVAVFTPRAPLVANTTYQVALAAASDLSGNHSPQENYNFKTTDHTPPTVQNLVLSGEGKVTEGGQAKVTATVAAGYDIAFVDFYVNDQLLGTDRQPPFEFAFEATPDYGQAGAILHVAAVATDVAGNRGPPQQGQFTIVADAPPTVAILTPAPGASVATHQLVKLSVQATDDIALSAIAFQALGGQPPAAQRTPLPDGKITATKEYSFHVPVEAIPASTITLNASATDNRGQEGKAVPVVLTVVDTTPPTVTVPGYSSGDHVKPGQKLTVVVSGHDAGGIASLVLQVSGAISFSETRAVTPATTEAATAFQFVVPTTASALDTVELQAKAVDQAGNPGKEKILLAVADTIAPRIASVSADFTQPAPGQTLTVTVSATDDLAINRLDLTCGDFAYADQKQITPPSNSAQTIFQVPVPANATVGAPFTLQASALDTSDNSSPPFPLKLMVGAQLKLSLPESVSLLAGDTESVQAHLSAPAPAGGVTITLSSENPDIAKVTPLSLVIPAGMQDGAFEVEGWSGGLATIDAAIAGMTQTSMKASVDGGVVSGVVLNEAGTSVSGVQLNINGKTVKTDAQGQFLVKEVQEMQVTVQAYDPDSKLSAYTSGTLNWSNGYLRNLKLTLQPTGSISGVALGRDLKTVGAGVQVDLFKPNHGGSDMPLQTAWTQDAAGHFKFLAVPLGVYELETADGAGNRGRTAVRLDKGGDTVQTVVSYLGRGSVTGTVVDAQGQAVTNAKIWLTATSLFDTDRREQPVTADGRFRFDNVFVGQIGVSAKDQNTQLGASAGGKLVKNEQTLELTLKLGKWGAIEGTVYRADGVTTVADALVQVGPVITTTNADGFYRLELLPLGKQGVQVQDRAGRGLRKTEINLDQHGATKPLNIPLLGQGTVIVQVNDANGQPAPGALLELTDVFVDAAFGPPLAAKTDAQGQATIERVNEGPFTVTAHTGDLGATGSAVLATAEMSLTLALAPTGTLTGTVFDPEGMPLKGVQLYLRMPSGKVIRTAVTGEDGLFHFTALPLLDYELDGYYQGLKRAKATALKLTQPNQTLTQNLTLVGLGVVTGQATAPTGYDASSLAVTLQSQHPDFARTLSGRTDAAGYYLIENVPAGAFTVSTGDVAKQLYGESTGQVTMHGQTVTADIALTANVVTLPTTLYEGNGFDYAVQKDGALVGGKAYFWSPQYGGGFKGGAALELVAGGQTYAFDGGPVATQEDFGRELVVRQNDLAGLNVTRKVYVPQEGYFVRYLEVLTNPGDEPVTVGVRIVNRYSLWGVDNFAVVTSSDGDDQLTVNRDLWATFDDKYNVDPFQSGSAMAASALIWAGTATSLLPDQLDLSIPTSISAPASMTIGWQTVTVPPGKSIALMHFVVLQISRAAAQASAERLAQLPPEALSGLSPTEIAQVGNFVIPEDGGSALSPLPRLGGEISGKVLAGDGATLCKDMRIYVDFKSDNIFFGRTYSVLLPNSTGYFDLKYDPVGYSNRPIIPVDSYTLKARYETWYPRYASSPPVAGAFPPGQTQVEQNVIFSNAGILQGVVRYASGIAVADVYLGIYPSGGGTGFIDQAKNHTDGAYRFIIVPEGHYTLSGRKQRPQGDIEIRPAPVDITAGQTTTLDVYLPIGAVSGQVVTASGQAVVNTRVELSGWYNFTSSTSTNESGHYTFTNLYGGRYLLEVKDPETGKYFQRTVTVTPDQTLTVDVRLPTFVNLPADYTDGGGFHWRIENNGTIGGENLAYHSDGGLDLSTGRYIYPFHKRWLLGFADASEPGLIIGPVWSVGNIYVSRKVFVPPNDAFIRFLDSFENLSDSDATIQVELRNDLGSAGATEIVQTSSGDRTFDLNDRYIITDDADGTGSPTMLHVFGGQNAKITPSSACSPCNYYGGWLRYSFTLTIPANKRVILLHFAAQSANRAAAVTKADQLYRLEGSALQGINQDEKEDIVNFVTLP